MQFKTLFITAASLSLSSPITATSTSTSPPPPGETYVSGFPLCGIAGFTEVPGNYNETIYQQSVSNLTSCIKACRDEIPECLSIAFNDDYKECLFYNAIVECTQLYEDGDSDFVHYDLPCRVY